MKLYLIFLFTPFLTYCQTNKFIEVNFNQEVNGYNITVFWIPNEVRFNKLVGPAILNFRGKNGEIYKIKSENFGLNKSLVPNVKYLNEYELKDFTKSRLNVDYDFTKLLSPEMSFGYNDLPFFFEDVNFDYDKELIITNSFAGQREVASFDVYKIFNGSINKLGSKPFSELDEFSKIDYDNRMIKIHSSNGYCGGITRFYKNTLDDEFRLVGELVQKIDNDTCYEYLYKLEDGKRTLINREKDKN